MSDLSVTSLSIDEVLRKLKGRDWLIPQFQRDFVWSIADVISLVRSILNTRPIGMATIWEQPDDAGLQLDALSLPDQMNGKVDRITFADTADNPKKVYAVLDGLQRSTAIAMAFGGFRSRHGDYKVSGRYFLNVAESDPLEQIVFVKEDKLKARQLDNDASSIARGLFPLSSSKPDESMLAQWLRYIQSIRDPHFYPDGKLPDTRELDRRDTILKQAFEGITKTKLAVFVVPESYKLSDICEIFETLNTTGTKVSTVDLIHSWLYSETQNDPEGSIKLRAWIEELGQKDGAIGWSMANDRPELVVQIATACYIALDAPKVPARSLSKMGAAAITSVKAADLLATPTRHWKSLIRHETQIAKFLGEFQTTVAMGLFPWSDCPYPATAAIYVGLRYHFLVDPPRSHRWGIEELNALYRAFFWRNALTSRYDQGFLTQMGTDLRDIKAWLNLRSEHTSSSHWAQTVDGHLTKLIQKPLPSKKELVNYLTDSPPSGALRKAFLLPMVARAELDLVDGAIHLSYPDNKAGVELHHIFPKAWCSSNQTPELALILDPAIAGRDWASSVANLMPLSRKSNNIWKAKIPGQLFAERNISFEHSKNILESAFIDEKCFEYLTKGTEKIEEFWNRRAGLIADDLLRKTEIAI